MMGPPGTRVCSRQMWENVGSAHSPQTAVLCPFFLSKGTDDAPKAGPPFPRGSSALGQLAQRVYRGGCWGRFINN